MIQLTARWKSTKSAAGGSFSLSDPRRRSKFQTQWSRPLTMGERNRLNRLVRRDERRGRRICRAPTIRPRRRHPTNHLRPRRLRPNCSSSEPRRQPQDRSLPPPRMHRRHRPRNVRLQNQSMCWTTNRNSTLTMLRRNCGRTTSLRFALTNRPSAGSIRTRESTDTTRREAQAVVDGAER